MDEQETRGGATTNVENPCVDSGNEQTITATNASTSYDIFEKCIIRAQNLVSVHESTQNAPNMSDAHYCDCYRAAVVLCISALDAYIRKVVVSEISKRIADKNRSLPKELSDYIKSLLNQDQLLDAARKYNLLESVEKAILADFSTKSFQGEWKITTHLKMVGHSEIFSAVAIKANINETNLKRKLTDYTKRRHVIAHSGDYDLNKVPHSENVITKDFAEDCIEIVSLFARTMNEIVEGK